MKAQTVSIMQGINRESGGYPKATHGPHMTKQTASGRQGADLCEQMDQKLRNAHEAKTYNTSVSAQEVIKSTFSVFYCRIAGSSVQSCAVGTQPMIGLLGNVVGCLYLLQSTRAALPRTLHI